MPQITELLSNTATKLNSDATQHDRPEDRGDLCTPNPRHGQPIEVKDLSCTFGEHRALDNISLSIQAGEMVALLGPSGAGKSTLLRQIAGLIPADASGGEIRVGGSVVQADGKMVDGVRRVRANIGFIFQQFNLVERVSLLRNVLLGNLSRMPLHRRLLGVFTRDEKLAAVRALRSVRLDQYAMQRSSTLSGGQQQRAAIARAMVQRASVLLADEPIASLDPASARMVMDGLRMMNRHERVTVVVSVHQVDHARRSCDRIVALRNGRVYCDCPTDELDADQVERLYRHEAE